MVVIVGFLVNVFNFVNIFFWSIIFYIFKGCEDGEMCFKLCYVIRYFFKDVIYNLGYIRIGVFVMVNFDSVIDVVYYLCNNIGIKY